MVTNHVLGENAATSQALGVGRWQLDPNKAHTESEG